MDSIVVHGKCFYPWFISCLNSIIINTISVYDIDNSKDLKRKTINSIIDTISKKSILINTKIET